jgi:type IV pilus assembly protein PilB
VIPPLGCGVNRHKHLRQDPDIMLIGETRDLEVAKIAVKSALTGHLVFTSLHTNDAPGAIMRLREMGIEGFLISAATIGVVAQRLVRRLCPKCKTPYTPDKKDLDYVGYRYDPEKMPTFYKAVGCPECNKGYSGRLGVYEIMKMNDELRDLIVREAPTALIRYAAKQSGMATLKDYSLKLVTEGHTSLDEVIRVTFSGEGEDKLCPSCRNPIGEEFMVCPFCQAELRKLCPKCKGRIEEGWKSCPSCGTLIGV